MLPRGYCGWALIIPGGLRGGPIRNGADDQRGLCAAGQEQWVSALLRLIDDVELRTRLGRAGRAHVQKDHSREALSDRLAAAFRHVAAAARRGR